MGTRTERHTLAGVPLTLVYAGPEGPEARARAARRGAVLFFHGLTADASVHAPELALLASVGLLAVGVDAVGHGARRYADFAARFPGAGPRQWASLLEVVRGTAAEVPSVLDALGAFGVTRAGLAGVSLGGYVTYAAALGRRDPRVRAAAPLLASPDWGEGEADSPHLQAGTAFPVALLAQTAALDAVVPPAGARALHARLLPRYAASPERLAYREYPDSGHHMREEDWEQARLAVAEWMVRFV